MPRADHGDGLHGGLGELGHDRVAAVAPLVGVVAHAGALGVDEHALAAHEHGAGAAHGLHVGRAALHGKAAGAREEPRGGSDLVEVALVDDAHRDVRHPHRGHHGDRVEHRLVVHDDHAPAGVVEQALGVLDLPRPQELGQDPQDAHDGADEQAARQRVLAQRVIVVVVEGVACEGAHAALPARLRLVLLAHRCPFSARAPSSGESAITAWTTSSKESSEESMRCASSAARSSEAAREES